MKAILQTKHHEDFSQVLREVTDHPIPVPDATKHQVRVRVVCAATNPIDYKFAQGVNEDMMKHPFPCPVGRDFSGTIDTDVPTGCPNPQNLKKGDRVCGWLDHEHLAFGSMAEFLCCPMRGLSKIPDGVGWRDAAALPLVANTIFVAFENMKITPNCGKSIVILGGSASTGILAIQLAKEYGCTAIVCTSTNRELCLGLGATEVIDYRTKDWSVELKGKGFDYVLDCVGGVEAYNACEGVLNPNGGLFYTIVGDITTGKMSIGRMLTFLCRASCRGCCGGAKYQLGMGLSMNADKGTIFWLDLVQRGRARVVIDPSSPYSFSAEGALKMLQMQASGRCKGKLVMEVCPPPS